MSNYMNVLKRLDEARRDAAPRTKRSAVEAIRPEAVATGVASPAPVAATPVAAASAPQAAAAPAPVALAPAPQPVATPLPPSARVSTPNLEKRPAAPVGFAGFASLFDRIQLLAQGRERYVVVLAPASHRESIGRVMAAMVTHAAQRQERAFFGELRGAGDARALIPRAGQGGGRDRQPRLPVDPSSDTTRAALSAWLDRHAPDDRLVLIEAPSLSDGLDASLLARACDGLIVVGEAEVSDRDALRVAGERARISGCNALGIAMIGTSDPMPRWLARIVRPKTAD